MTLDAAKFSDSLAQYSATNMLFARVYCLRRTVLCAANPFTQTILTFAHTHTILRSDNYHRSPGVG